MMRRLVIAVAIVLGAFGGLRAAHAHVGSYDVFYEGEAGPYPVFVTVRMPQVIPGVAQIEVRARTSDVTSVSVVPMRLTGPGSELPPTPDRATRSSADPQFFTAELWLMEHGSMQVRVFVEGKRGPGTMSVPIPAVAQSILTMDRTLGAVLFALMTLLALAFISIVVAGVREAAVAPGEQPPRNRKRLVIASVIASSIVIAALWLGKWWWDAEASTYASFVAQPWKFDSRVEGCTLSLPIDARVMKDHGHDMHLFVVRTGSLDRLAHLHPVRRPDGGYDQQLPSLPAGDYTLFADIVLPNGFPVTGTSTMKIPDLRCPAPTGDDAVWNGEPSSIVLDPPIARVGVSQLLRFRILNEDGTPATDLHPYMAMAGHVAVVRKDLSVFAHLHPNGSIAMPALMIAKAPHEMHEPAAVLPPEITFPYGFPTPGDYRIFVQVKRDERIVTGSFDVTVAP
jgi:hypothetical protein